MSFKLLYFFIVIFFLTLNSVNHFNHGYLSHLTCYFLILLNYINILQELIPNKYYVNNNYPINYEDYCPCHRGVASSLITVRHRRAAVSS